MAKSKIQRDCILNKLKENGYTVINVHKNRNDILGLYNIAINRLSLIYNITPNKIHEAIKSTYYHAHADRQLDRRRFEAIECRTSTIEEREQREHEAGNIGNQVDVKSRTNGESRDQSPTIIPTPRTN